MGLLEEFSKTLVPPICSPKTKEAYMQGAKRFIRHVQSLGVELPSAPSTAMESFVLAMSAENLAANSIRLYVIGADQFIDWCRRHGVLVPEQGDVRLPKIKKRKPVILEPQMLAKYMVACSKKPEVYAGGLQLLPITGLRVDEMCQLRLENVHKTPPQQRADGSTSLPGIELLVSGKSKSERSVPILPAGIKLFARYLVNVRPGLGDSPWLFPVRKGPLSKRKAQQYVAEIREELGVEVLTPHTLRHTYATYLARAGWSAFAIAKVLGHENVNTSNIYVHLNNSDLDFSRVNTDWIKED